MDGSKKTRRHEYGVEFISLQAHCLRQDVLHRSLDDYQDRPQEISSEIASFLLSAAEDMPCEQFCVLGAFWPVRLKVRSFCISFRRDFGLLDFVLNLC